MGRVRRIGAGALGYRRRIRQLLQEREALANDAETRLRAAEGKFLGLRRELARLEEQLKERDAQIRELTAQIESFARDPERPTPNMLAGELNAILSSAQEAAARMIDRAKAVSERHLQHTSQFERELHEELTKMDEWRQQAVPLIRMVQARIGEIRATLEGVAESVAETVRPLEQFPHISRRPGLQPEAPRPSEPTPGEVPVTKLEPPEGEGNGRRTRRRPARTKPTQSESGSKSEVIEIPNPAEAR